MKLFEKLFFYIKKFIKFLDEDSWQSTIINILLAFLIIKFLVFPGLSFVLNSDFPIVAVVSQSMQHDNPLLNKKTDFDDWYKYHETYYNNYNITKNDFLKFPQKNGFRKGDILFIYGKRYESLDIGDVIVFEGGLIYPIIHRIINVTKENGEVINVQTKGDNNPYSINSSPLNEFSIKKDEYYGKAFFKIPYIGLIKIYLFKLLGLE